MFKNRSLGRDIIQVWCFNHLVSITSQSIPTLLVGQQKQDIRVCHALDYQVAHSAKSTETEDQDIKFSQSSDYCRGGVAISLALNSSYIIHAAVVCRVASYFLSSAGS